MLFSEVYSSYYNAVAKILSLAVSGSLTKKELYAAVQDSAFAESITVIPDSLMSGAWPLLHPDLTTPIGHAPSMPLTELQRRWLKSLLSDPRIRLFSPCTDGLEDVQPLFSAEDFVYFDRYSDGDDFTDPRYIERFSAVLTAIREKRLLHVMFTGRHGRQARTCVVQRMEYSSKDDKFRVIAFADGKPLTVNMARMTDCRLLEERVPEHFCPPEPDKEELVLELTDRRNALERAMLAFSHLEKETRRLDDTHYRITLRYYREDRTEMLIRVLSFGPLLRVISPEAFIGKLRERLDMQKNLPLG